MSSHESLTAQLDRLADAALGVSSTAGPLTPGGDEYAVGAHMTEAGVYADVSSFPLEPGRGRSAKRAVYGASRPFLRRQAEFNRAILEALGTLNHQVAEIRNRLDLETNKTADFMARSSVNLEDVGRQLSESSANLRDQILDQANAAQARLEVAVAEAATSARASWASDIEAARASIESSTVRVDGTEAESIRRLSAAHRELSSMVGSLTAKLDHLIAGQVGVFAADPSDHLVFDRDREALIDADNNLYERFEDRYRGTDAAIAARLEPYLGDLYSIGHRDGTVIDIGSGRGEWLELLARSGFEAVGVDTNQVAVDRCETLGLKAVCADGVEYLRNVEDRSLLAVTSFHVFEHVPPAVYRVIVDAARKSLKPGGLLIVETPNPTNVTVGSAAFYLDPTHLRPVNPEYLQFLCEDAGFVDVEIRFLHPRSGYESVLTDGEATLQDELMWALRGPQDFAVIAHAPHE